MIEKITSIINNDPIFYGLVLILLAITSLALRIYFKESFKMKDHNIMSWKAYVNSWAFIVPFIWHWNFFGTTQYLNKKADVLGF